MQRVGEVPEEELRLVRRIPGRADPQQVLPTDRHQRQPHSDRRERRPWRQSVRTAEELDAEAGAEGRHQRPAGGAAEHGPAALGRVHRPRRPEERLLQARRHPLKLTKLTPTLLATGTNYSRRQWTSCLTEQGLPPFCGCSAMLLKASSFFF